MKKLVTLIFPLILIACTSGSSSSEKPRPVEWHGAWTAQWETLPESYPGIENMTFSMGGKFIFTSDSLTVQANGFEGCIFNSDTLSHTQSWYVENDTLFLLNDPEMPGMTYIVKSIADDSKIELQLMDDIFVTLTK